MQLNGFCRFGILLALITFNSRDFTSIFVTIDKNFLQRGAGSSIQALNRVTRAFIPVQRNINRNTKC
jgi:hypothetical protein